MTRGDIILRAMHGELVGGSAAALADEVRRLNRQLRLIQGNARRALDGGPLTPRHVCQALVSIVEWTIRPGTEAETEVPDRAID